MGANTNVHVADIRAELKEFGWEPILTRGTHERWGKGGKTVEFTIRTGGQVAPAGVREVRSMLKAQKKETKVEKGEVKGQQEEEKATIYAGMTMPEVDSVYKTQNSFRPVLPLATKIVVTEVGRVVRARRIHPELGPEFRVEYWSAEAHTPLPSAMTQLQQKVKAAKESEGRKEVAPPAPVVEQPKVEPPKVKPKIEPKVINRSTPSRDAVVAFVVKQKVPVSVSDIAKATKLTKGGVTSALQTAVKMDLVSARGIKKSRRYWHKATDAEWVEAMNKVRKGNKGGDVPIESVENLLAEMPSGLVLSAVEWADRVKKSVSWVRRILEEGVKQGVVNRKLGSDKYGGLFLYSAVVAPSVTSKPESPKPESPPSVSTEPGHPLQVPLEKLKEKNKAIHDAARTMGWRPEQGPVEEFIQTVFDTNTQLNAQLTAISNQLDILKVPKTDALGNKHTVSTRMGFLLTTPEAPKAVTPNEPALNWNTPEMHAQVQGLAKKLDTPAVRFLMGRAPTVEDLLERIIRAGISAVEKEIGGEK